MNEDIKPTWKNTFNSQLGFWGYSDRAIEMARDARYQFFEWNGRIYKTNDFNLMNPICRASELD